MNIDFSVLKNDEKAIFELRTLYQKHGYSRYKMNKFEEYDLYVRNKDFLVSDNIITFTDTNGKLMALKPDVTLSIIKNGKDKQGVLEKVYYNENVYRVSKGSKSYKEIMQVGLECIGDIDDFCIYEVICLAAESLANISPDYVLDISHMGIVSQIISEIGLSHAGESELLKCIAEKNIHGILALCEKEGIAKERISLICAIVNTSGRLEEVIPELEGIFAENEQFSEIGLKFIKIARVLSKCEFAGNLRVDFSVINDMNYYGGIVFKGFVSGIPTGILSGGEYNKLMQKMGRRSGAIGFAVYLDMLERLSTVNFDYDVDAIVLYDENTDIEALKNCINMLATNGNRVLAQKEIPENIKYKQLLRIRERGVEILENNA